MRVSTLIASAFAGLAAAAPYSPFPLKDGFPSPSAAQLKAIEVLAGGSLPGGPLATELTALATATVQLIAANEIFEVAYFTELLANLTNGVEGYTTFPATTTKEFVIDTITAIKNQEELHALGANAILATAKKPTVAPCSYNIPVNSFSAAIALANTFTDVVLGVLPMAQTVFAADNNDELPYVNLVGSIIAQEAEQNGWYRSVQSKIPSAAPFLTTEGPNFAFTFLSSVIAPGCAVVDTLKAAGLTIYPALNVLGHRTPTTSDVNVEYEVPGIINENDFSLVYLSGQNLPQSVKIYEVKCANGISTFKADFPFSSAGFAKGLTIAAVVNMPYKNGAFMSSAEVAKATVYGPGIIEVA